MHGPELGATGKHMNSEQNREEAAPANVAQVRPAAEPMELDERGLYRIVNAQHEFRIAKMMIETRAVPSSFQTPQQVVMALQALKSLGLNWRTAIRQCAFNQQGVFTVFGDLELAVVRQSGLLDNIHEFLYVVNEGKCEERCFANSNLHLPVAGAVCRLKRKSIEQVHEATCSIEDAKQAGLWGKTPTWNKFPGRMMQMRARGMAIRNMFSDVTQGLAGHEYDVEGIDYGNK
jgi:hypothetical protein